jgi:dedicated sortase system histidine kinase
MRPRFWHRVRFKLLLVSLTLLGIPWAGYRFIQETEQFLRDAQAQALRTTASSVANIMHGLDDVFHGTARPGSVLTFRNLYLHPLAKAPQLDGYRDDWVYLDNNFTTLRTVDGQLSARVFLGQHGRYLYLLLGVTDPVVTYGATGDTVDLAFTGRDGSLRRLRIQPRAPGWVIARPVDASGEIAPESDSLVRGEWQNTADGYTLELRLPRERVGDRLSLRFRDGDSGQLLASGHLYPAERLGRIVSRNPGLTPLLESVSPAATRVWVTDHQGLVIARAGQLDENPPLGADQSRMPWFVRDLILAVLPREADIRAELPDDQTHLFIEPVIDALSGRPASLRRQPAPGDAVVVSAAVPIRSAEGVEGAVLVEQTTNAILSIQNLALQRLFGVTLLLFAVTSLGLLVFASLLASRITRLRDRVEGAVSHDGRILARLQSDHARDEIGDLGRSFASVLDRLHDYNHYLEAMAARLAHELRTPLAVVKHSLDNAEQTAEAERAAYVARARHGVERLEHILNRLREATGLEQALREAEAIDFDLASLVRLQTDGYRDTFPQQRFVTRGVDAPLPVHGVPDLLSQALDKLVGNAIDFHAPDTPITIGAERRGRELSLRVHNLGPPLPGNGDIFQSMFSQRSGRQDEPHLGLGLYLVRLICEYHGGSARAADTSAPGGVEVVLTLPIAR